MKRRRASCLLYLALSLWLIAAGCGSGMGAIQTAGAESSGQSTGSANVPAAAVDTVTPVPSPGVVATIAVVYPYGEPAAPVVAIPTVPVYPGARLVKVDDTDIRLRREYLTADDPEAVYSFYRSELPKYGWEPYPDKYSHALRYGYPPPANYVPIDYYGKAWGHYLFVAATSHGNETLISTWTVEESWKSLATPIPVPVIPEYPGATLVSQEVVPPDDDPAVGYGELWRTYDTRDGLEEVFDFYFTHLRELRWSCSPYEADRPGYLYCTYGSGVVEKYHLRIWLTREDNTTHIKMRSLHSDR